MTDDLLWPRYAAPTDLAAIEAVPLADRDLPETTYALLARAATRWPARTALSVLPDAARWREPESRSFAELLADVHRCANLLHRLGVRRGDAVALMAPNCAQLVTAMLAAQLAGIAAPVNGALSRPHLAELLRRSGARVLITAGPELAPEVWETARALADELDAVLVLRPTGAGGAAPPLDDIAGVRVGYIDEQAATEDAEAFAGEPPRSADLAAFFHTGGTTGAPKLAAHTHANEVADAWMLAANSLIDPDTVVFGALPLFHVNALVVTLLAPLFKGQRVVWAGPLGYRDAALFGEFWRIVEHHRIATMSAVATVYATLAQVPVDADISSLRFAMVGASPLPPAVRTDFQQRTGVPLLEGYGLTEATCASARSFPDAPRPGAVGQRLPYQHMTVLENGVLAISGPTVFPGYVVGREDHGYRLDGLGKLVDGWLDTGDLAEIDEDGFVHLRGRAKDLIIRGGHNIDPALIEDALLAHPHVTAAAAVGRPDAHAGEVPVAYVAVAPGAAVDEVGLLAWAAQRVPERAAVPKAVTVLDALPLTAVGKPYKLDLRADATRRAVADALAAVPDAEVEAHIDDGSVVVTVTAPTSCDRTAIGDALGAYAVTWNLHITQDAS
ncbi:acyl-CoA synthetase [Actinomycetospora straminea]|uniref:Acyl-CoA synthetase n=1 Tax=Actinomycetospora straminea TaxID=663607 RepID=A0ABP9ETI0_9PSEU|nr:acyl-CoA synthetase [Actinomycetospora straminea]MDD7931465.1 acyl-CoA synthetase [Actinomycetospora straminea]